MGAFEETVNSYVGRNNVYTTPIKRSVYILSIESDGIIKYAHSYSGNMTVDTIYFADADDDKMSVPYGFRSYKQAEAIYWDWAKRRDDGKKWYFHIEEIEL